MVKNTTGGNKSKGQARKFINAVPKSGLRLSSDELELYARVTKNLGNGMCHVICIDGETRLCHIRGKFRGRGKKNNLVGLDTILLVGLREWEQGSSKKEGKIQNCDLLEVYNDSDKQRLMDSVSVNWDTLVPHDSNSSGNINDIVDFEDNKTSEYHELINLEIQNNKSTKIVTINDEDEIDINDI